jgi:TonB family protein
MFNAWKRWEGQVVNSEYPLLRYLGGSEHSAVFLTEFLEGDRRIKAAIKLIPAGGENDDLQLSRWRLAGDLSHPNLISLFDGGRCEVDGVALLYIVMECAEENLAQVLPSRALTPDETRETLNSLLDVLGYLHGKGFVHGHIKPVNIMADGDQLKLSSDALCRAGESLKRSGKPDAYDPPEKSLEAVTLADTISPAVDVWSLGMTLVEVMTQKLPVAPSAGQREPTLLEALQEPFFDIARHCLARHPQDRWSVAQIAARLQAPSPAPPISLPLTEPHAQPLQTHATARPQTVAASRAPRPAAKRSHYGLPIAVGIALALAAILVGPRLLHRNSDATQSAAATLEQPLVPSASEQVTQTQREDSAKISKSDAENLDKIEGHRNSEPPTPVPASIHPESVRNEPTNTAATLPTGNTVRSEVAQQVLPEVAESAKHSIRGTVKVRVRVGVDQSGNVETAELESSGPSKYFARMALGAAKRWKFKPAKVVGQDIMSNWILRFEFTRDGTTVIPKQEIP